MSIEQEEDYKKYSQFEKVYHLIEYLKWNTDMDHRVRQKDLKRVKEIKKFLGDKGTFTINVKRMSDALNTNMSDGILDLSDWKFVYDGLLREQGYLGGDEEEDDNDEFLDGMGHKVGQMYYQHSFSYKEINYMIQGLLALDTVETNECMNIIEKIKRECTSKYYKGANEQVSRVYRKGNCSADQLNESITLIQTAIEDHVEIEFLFSGYNRERQLVANKKKRDRICPYYLVVNGGNYYVIGCWVTERIDNPNMSIWRVDLMENLKIPERNERNNIKGRTILEKHKVQNLPQQWDEKFFFSHLNMSFDQPKTITLKIKSPKDKANKAIRADYTFLHDTFGDAYSFKEQQGDYDIIEVKSSPFGMVNWALQYSDRVEVVKPIEVRDAVIAKVRALNEKYHI